MQNMTNEHINSDLRNSGLDILRIVCIVLIILGHMYSETFLCTLSPGADKIAYYFCTFLCHAPRLAINCFVMISAWFLCDKNPNAKKFLSTWCMVFFFNALITALVFAFSDAPFSIVLLIQSLLPIIGRPQWYMCEYMLLLLISPLLNHIMHSVAREAIKLLLIMGFIFIIIPATMLPVNYTPPLFSEFIWFVYIYLFVSYIRKFDIHIKIPTLGLLLAAALSYAFIVLLTVVPDFMMTDKYGLKNQIKSLSQYYINHYEALPEFVCALSLFLLFLNFQIKNPLMITTLSKSTGVIYIIHTVPVFWRLDCYSIWENIFHLSLWYEKGCVLIGMICTTAIIMIAGSLFYLMWISLIMPLLQKFKLYQYIEKRTTYYYSNFDMKS